jgi:cytochrome c biogenesis protein CcmG/thiol:disulfide interchange protein DsbE
VSPNYFFSLSAAAGGQKPEGAQQMETEQQNHAAPTTTHKRRIIFFVLAIIVNGGLLAVLATALFTPATNQSSTKIVSETQLGAINSPLIGKPAPDFALPALNGNSATIIQLKNLKGKAVVLNFWQSSCDPCNTEAPIIQKTWTQVQSKGVVIIGVDVQDTSIAAHTFLHKYGITYLNVTDTLSDATINNYDITGFPETYFINKAGLVTSKWIGPLNTQGIQSELSKLTHK